MTVEFDVTKYFAYLTYEYEPVKIMQGNIILTTIGEDTNKFHAFLDTFEDVKNRKKYTLCGIVHRSEIKENISIYKFNKFPEGLTILDVFKRMELYNVEDV